MGAFWSVAHSVSGESKMAITHFTITWRIENGGDFFEQTFKNQKSASLAIKAWRESWGLHECECYLFEIRKAHDSVLDF